VDELPTAPELGQIASRLGCEADAAFSLWLDCYQYLEAYRASRQHGAGAFIGLATPNRGEPMPAYWKTEASMKGLMTGLDHHYRLEDVRGKRDTAEWRAKEAKRLKEKYKNRTVLSVLGSFHFGNGNEWDRAMKDLIPFFDGLPVDLKPEFKADLEQFQKAGKAAAPFCQWNRAAHFELLASSFSALVKKRSKSSESTSS
jgi:hypothetical protein